MATILHLVRLRIQSVKPRTNRTRHLSPCVVACNFVAIAGSPDDIAVGGVGNREAALAAAQTVLPRRRTAAPSASAEIGLPRHIRPGLDYIVGAAHSPVV